MAAFSPFPPYDPHVRATPDGRPRSHDGQRTSLFQSHSFCAPTERRPSCTRPTRPPETPAQTVTEDYRELPIGGGHLNEHALSEQKRLAIELLVSGKKVGKVAEAVGVTPKTLFNWRHDDADFIAELNRRRHALWDESADHLRALVHEAVDVMEWHLRDRYDRNRFRAASAILSTSNIRSVIPIAPDPD